MSQQTKISQPKI